MKIRTVTDTEAPVNFQAVASKFEESTPAHEKYKFLIWEFETRIKWLNVFQYTIFHALAVWCLFKYPFWNHSLLYSYGFIVMEISGFGITGGVHRYWTHRSFKAKLPLKLIFIVCYSLAGQYSPLSWVRDHRLHHKCSETSADPHNAKRGFFFAHMGWLMMKKHPDVIRKGKSIDISDLLEDPLMTFFERYFLWFKIIICFVLPTLIPPYLFGESWEASIMLLCFPRYLFGLHFTWLVNSAAHLWGNKPYDKRINPVENLYVSLLAIGEGYHNYHHTFPWDYQASEFGKGLNVTAFWLNFFKYLGWAYDLKTPSPALVKKMIETHGDGSHLKWGHEVPVEQNFEFSEIKKFSISKSKSR